MFRSALVDKADLPKCASIACYNCKHVAYVYHPANGALYLLGCAKGGNVCGGFEHSHKDAGAADAVKDALLQLLRYQFPELQGAVSAQVQEGDTYTIPKGYHNGSGTVSGGWVDGQQTVAVDGISEDSILFAGGDMGSEPAYSASGVYCSGKSAGQLTFTCSYAPDEDVVANVIILK